MDHFWITCEPLLDHFQFVFYTFRLLASTCDFPVYLIPDWFSGISRGPDFLKFEKGNQIKKALKFAFLGFFTACLFDSEMQKVMEIKSFLIIFNGFLGVFRPCLLSNLPPKNPTKNHTADHYSQKLAGRLRVTDRHFPRGFRNNSLSIWKRDFFKKNP